jgi:hypothetical protein
MPNPLDRNCYLKKKILCGNVAHNHCQLSHCAPRGGNLQDVVATCVSKEALDDCIKSLFRD